MSTDHDLRLTLFPSSNDGALFSRKCQHEITRFYVEARADGNHFSHAAFVLNTVAHQAGFTGEFTLPLTELVGPALVAAAGAWLAGRVERKIGLRIRDIDVETKSPKEFDRLVRRMLTLPPVQPAVAQNSYLMASAERFSSKNF
jgi:hypothetical protein